MAKVVEMYGEGDYIVCSGTTYPMNIPTATGGTKGVFDEWNKRYYYSSGVTATTWVDNVRAVLTSWEENINEVADQGWTFLESCMKQYYILPDDWDVTQKIL